MLSVKDRVTYCSICSNITDVDPCYLLHPPDRDARLICVVEQPENVAAIEKTRGFRGRYHVLMGAIAPLQGIGPDDLKIKGLLTRVGEGGVEEVILATNPNVEGRSDRALSRPAAQAARRARHPHRDGRAGRQRPRLHRRVHDVQGDGRAEGGLT